jgi:chromosome partitioning protein
MQIIGVAGRKGGSGKSTLAVHLAAELATRGEPVVLVDCDPQASATHWAEPGHLPMPVQHMPLEQGANVARWSKAIRGIQAAYLVLDSPPHLDAALGGIIGLADLAVVPCGPSGLDLVATAETVSLIREIRDARGDAKPRILLVPNRVDRRTASSRELARALKDLGETVAGDIGARTAFSDAFNAGVWVGKYAPGSVAHVEMRAFADEVLAYLSLEESRHGKKKRAVGA